MDNVLIEFISNTSTDVGLTGDHLESTKIFKTIKQNLKETNLDEDTEIAYDVKKCDNHIVKSSSDPSISKTVTEMTNLSNDANQTVIDEPKISIKLNDASINQSFDKLKDTKSMDKLNNNQPQASSNQKLFRGISRATDNMHLVSKVRGDFAQGFQTIKDNDSFNGKLNLELPEHTFTLPDISIHPDDFRQFLEKDLIEKSTLSSLKVSLKNSKRLNWWCSDLNIAQKLWPLSTTGDGNCLLHACSLGTWGFHDRLLTLRKALHYYLINSSSDVDTFYKRWRWQCLLENKKAGLILGEEELKNDWLDCIKMASIEPRVVGSNYVKVTNGGKKKICEEEFANHVYESLEEIHILALSHVLKRPIIVISDTVLRDVKNEPFAPITFGGIYLPLQCDPKDCNRSPLCLTYDAAHFSSLVAMDHESYADRTLSTPAVIPLVDHEGSLLQVQFVVEPPDDLDWDKMNENDEEIINKLTVNMRDKIDLLNKYLDLVYIDKNTKEIFTSEKFNKKLAKDKLEKETEIKIIEIEIDNVDNQWIDSLHPPTSIVNSNKLSNIKNQSSSTQWISSIKESNITSETVRKKKLSFSFASLTQKFNSLRRSMSKRFRRNLNTVNANVNSLVRRSSFRLSRRSSKLNKSESQNKSANNLDTAILSNSLSPPSSNKRPSLSSTVDKSPSKQSTKLNKSIKSTSNNSPTKSLNSSSTQAEIEESILPSNFILAADMHIDRQPSYRDEFIRNYLSTARLRFLNECDSKSAADKCVQKVSNSSEYSNQDKDNSTNNSASSTSLNSRTEDFAQCVNNGCCNFGKSSLSYLCNECHILQKKHEELIELRSNIESIH